MELHSQDRRPAKLPAQQAPEHDLAACWVLDGRLAIGNFLNAKDTAFLALNQFSAILSLDGSLRGASPEELGVKEIRSFVLVDGRNDQGTFARAVLMLKGMLDEFPRVLVQCHAGRSRSPAVVAAYLVTERGLTLPQALERVRAVREVAMAEPLMASVQRFCRAAGQTG